jgi:transposase
MEFGSDVDRCREAVRLVEDGVSVAETARRVGRSRWWVHEWLNRVRRWWDAWYRVAEIGEDRGGQ